MTEHPPAELSLSEMQAIGESVVGAVDWRGEEGLCICPGASKHTSRNAPTDCKVIVRRTAAGVAPGVYCFHGACSGDTAAASHQVRSLLGRRTPSNAPRQLTITRPNKPKPAFSPEKLERIAAKIPAVTDDFLAAISPKAVHNCTPASFLHALTRPSERIVVFSEFRSQGQHVWTHQPPPFDARELDAFRAGAREGVWFLNNPVTGDYLPSDSGKPSRRSRQNVTSWRYLVLESDEANPAHWLAALAQIPLRIASLATSGGKSIHALVRVDADSKSAWDSVVESYKPILVTLGADPKAMSAVRLTRLPLCERGGWTDKEGVWHAYETPHLQRLLYLNPDPNGTPLCDRPAAPCFEGETKPADQDGLNCP